MKWYKGSYFVKALRKCTWFSVAPCILSNTGNGQFGHEFDCTLNRSGDIALRAWLRIKLSSVTCATPALAGHQYFIRWTRNFMHNIIREISIQFTGLPAHIFDNTFLDMWSAFTVPEGKRNGYFINMIGNDPDLIQPGTTLPEAILNLPLPFFFTRDTGLGLPTAALPYNDIVIKTFFNDWPNLLIVDDVSIPIGGGTTAGVSRPANISDVSTPPTLEDCQIWTEYALVSSAERKLMGKRPRDMFIYQTQKMPVQSVNATLPSSRADLRFSNSVSALFFGIRNNTNQAEWSNYTCASPLPTVQAPSTTASLNETPLLATDPVSSVVLLYDNQQRLSNMPADYFTLIQPFYVAVSIPQLTGYHLYSYSLDLVSTDPKGSTNYGKLSAVQLLINHSDDLLVAGGTANIGTFSIPNPAPLPAPYQPGSTYLNSGAGIKQTYEINTIVSVEMKILASPFLRKLATLSNCGNTLKPLIPNTHSNRECGGVNNSRYGKNSEFWGNPQPNSHPSI